MIARKIAELFGFNHGVRPIYTACCFDELGGGSVFCLLNASFEKQFHNATTQLLCQKSMTMASTGAVQGTCLPTGGIRWPRPSILGDALGIWHRTNLLSWQSKWPAKEVHSFVIAAFFG